MLLFGAEPLMAVLQLYQHMSCLKKTIGKKGVFSYEERNPKTHTQIRSD